MTAKRIATIATIAALALASCGKKEEPAKAPPPPSSSSAPAPAPTPAAPAPVAVASVSVGKSIDAGKKVSAATDTFAKSDTMYASVETTGTGTAKLDAKWTFHKGDKVAPVKDETMTITTSGPATNEFHVSKPDGWPAGDYQVEILLDGKPAGTRKFTVK